MSKPKILGSVILALLFLLLAGACASSPAVTDGEGPGVVPPSVTPPDATAVSERPAPPPSDPPEPPAPRIGPVSTAGIPFTDLMPLNPGLRLEYGLIRGGVPADESIALVFQPSREAWANLTVHGTTVHGTGPAGSVASYVIMGQDETTWYPALPLLGDPTAAVLAAIPWPRYLPHRDEVYRFSKDDLTARVRPEEPANPGNSEDQPAAWSIGYRIDREYGRGLYGEVLYSLAFVGAEPGERQTLAPVLIRYADPRGTELRYELQSAAVYREREITGVVVSSHGRPQVGVAVAPHPMIGLLPDEHRGITGPNGVFSISYRGAPGDVIRLFYGPVGGEGRSARITQPQEIVGRIESPDFATLIYTAP